MTPVIGTPAALSSRSLPSAGLILSGEILLPLTAVLLVAVPVFLQAPLVRQEPVAATLLTLPLVAGAVMLERHGRGPWQQLGPLLVGFSGSWLAGCLFWGWFRLHPLLHLPIEAFAMPLAVAGLGSRWRLAGAFYLASLVGTAATDSAIALTGLMPLWLEALSAPLSQAPAVLRLAGETVLEPANITLVAAMAALILAACAHLWRMGGIARVSAATLATTLAVDGLFLAAALLAPQWSGVI
jgi:hypothetical protein